MQSRYAGRHGRKTGPRRLSRRQLLRRGATALSAITFATGMTDVAAQEATPERFVFGEWIAALLRESRIPGVSMAVIQDGHLAWTAAFGLRDAAAHLPMTTGTLFQAASVSKPVAAVAAVLAFAE